MNKVPFRINIIPMNGGAKMAKYIYPAVFTNDGDCVSVNFPDLESCYTQGDDLQDAYDMAEDVMCLTLYNLEESDKAAPKASDISAIKVGAGSFVSLVTCDTVEYRKFFDSKAVKKTLTIPSWLNTMAEREEINFSAVLQRALKAELGV